jgi:FKBP-type peptidyl-prolyl cis-trans isomerase
MALQSQQQIYQTYGPQNGLVTLTQIRNTLADMLAIGGLRNSDRYFMPMTQEIEQQMMMQAQQQQEMMAQQQQADPNAAFLQAEQMKAQTRAQVDMTKAQMDYQYKMHKLGMDDDLQRDEMVQDLAVKVAEILGKYGTAVDVASVKAEQDEIRQHNAQMMGMGNGY